jgi:hypothetical protein
VTVNGQRRDNVGIHEGDDLNVTCSVDGKPTPTLSITRNSREKIIKTNQSISLYVINRKARCKDTDTYRCKANSTGFPDNYTEVTLNVLCKLIWNHYSIISFLGKNDAFYTDQGKFSNKVLQQWYSDEDIFIIMYNDLQTREM